MGFGVDEFLHLLDLQVPVCVSDDLCDVDRFAGRLPDLCLQVAGDLWVDMTIKYMQLSILASFEYGRGR